MIIDTAILGLTIGVFTFVLKVLSDFKKDVKESSEQYLSLRNEINLIQYRLSQLEKDV